MPLEFIFFVFNLIPKLNVIILKYIFIDNSQSFIVNFGLNITFPTLFGRLKTLKTFGSAYEI